jgi:hypothetical protein
MEFIQFIYFLEIEFCLSEIIICLSQYYSLLKEMEETVYLDCIIPKNTKERY